MTGSAACCEVHKLGKCDAVFTCCDKCPTFFGPGTSAARKPPWCPECGGHEDLPHDDIRAIMLALGISDHARPYSTHAVVHREILPAIRNLLALLDAYKEASRG